jgi:hypothetical protein
MTVGCGEGWGLVECQLDETGREPETGALDELTGTHRQGQA